MAIYTSNKPSGKYFAAEDAEKTVPYLKRKGDTWFQSLNHNRYLEKIKRSWLSYHGHYYEQAHAITFGGESGELVNLAVNHYRNIASHIVTMVTSNRPAFQAKSINTDYKSQVQTVLANGLLEYYMRDKRLEKYLKKAVEYAVVLGSGYIKMEWNATSGQIYDYVEPSEEEIQEYVSKNNGKLNEKDLPPELESYPIYEGDVEFRNLSPLDVVFDNSKESAEEHDWVLVRTFKNKYDLAAKYPEMADKIKGLMTKSDHQRYRISLSPLDETDDVPVYEFFHRKTESLPEGRYILYLDDDVILMDTPMPYRRLPVYRISPGDILGTAFGYTPMFDLIPMQDALNSLYSTILTNQNAFGVQNILNPRGNDVRLNQVEGGLNFIEYNPQAGKPEALNLTQTPAEIFNFSQVLERNMETISGVNSVARGNPEASLKSGNALALVQSQALQFINGLQQSYVMMVEDIGTGLIELLQDFAKVPRIAEIAGVSNKTKMKEFTGDDLDSIRRVVVDVGNAMSQTAAGRTQMADNLIQMGLIKTPEQYFAVMNTGRLDVMTEGQLDHSLLIKAENERLAEGEEVVATAIDAHSLHIRQHMNILADPDLRLDAELVARTLAHIQEHIDLSRTTDPDLLAMIGEQPLAPQGGSPVAQGTVAPPNPNEAPSPATMMENPQSETTQPTSSTGLPNPAEAPVGPDGMPLQASERPLTSG